MNLILILLLLSFLVRTSDCDIVATVEVKRIYNLGGLFESILPRVAFNLSLYGEVDNHLKFILKPEDVNDTDSFTSLRKACSLTSNDNGVAAILRSGEGQDALTSVCNKLNVLELFISPAAPMDRKTIMLELSKSSYSFYYHPSSNDISKAIARLVDKLKWDKFVVLYEDITVMYRLQETLKNRATKHDPSVKFFKLNVGDDNRYIFKEMFDKRDNFAILDCDSTRVANYFKEIVKVNNKTDYQSYILTSLDAYRLDFSTVPEMLANVSTLHLSQVDDPLLIIDESHWDYSIRQLGKDSSSLPDYHTTETILAADAGRHIAKALKNIPLDDNVEEINSLEPRIIPIPSLCASTREKWEHGEKLLASMLETKIDGLTGNIEFDNEGKRINYKLYHSELKGFNFTNIGYWNSSTDSYVVTRSGDSSRQDRLKVKRIIKIGSTEGKPYFSKRNGTNDTYDGFVVDLINLIFEKMRSNGDNFTYEFYVNKGGQDALIMDILNNEAELAICDMTITADRMAKVDFSLPFMDLGISILFKKPQKEPPNMFSFMQPLALDLWLYLGTTYLLTSFIIFLCARMSQEDWVNPHPCDRNPDRLENIWNLHNSTWLTMGAIMTQGCDILPRAVGSRWVTAAWWFFALIITSSYTSNMSVFISNTMRSFDIQSVEDLVNQNKVKYGVMEGKSTYKFFKNSNDTLYKKVWTVMQNTRPSVFVPNNENGKERVKKSKNYAFFMESTSIEYFTNRDCDLRMVGGRLDSKGYGIAMPKNFPHRAKINNAIIHLQETGKIEELKRLWWEEKENYGNCKEKEELEKSEEGDDQMEKMSGIFLVLGIGALLAVIVALGDFISHARKVAVKTKVDLKTAIKIEWKASLNPRSLTKPAVPLESTSRSTSPTRDNRSQSRAASLIRAASSFINLDRVY